MGTLVSESVVLHLHYLHHLLSHLSPPLLLTPATRVRRWRWRHGLWMRRGVFAKEALEVRYTRDIHGPASASSRYDALCLKQHGKNASSYMRAHWLLTSELSEMFVESRKIGRVRVSVAARRPQRTAAAQEAALL